VGEGQGQAAGYLLFSEIPLNSIYKWEEGKGRQPVPQAGRLSRRPHRHEGARQQRPGAEQEGRAADVPARQPAHAPSWRRWPRPAGKQVALADKFDGKRFNSPNDLVVHSSGDIFFTDPPYGLAKRMEDKEKEIPFQGVYRLDTKGKVHLLSTAWNGPTALVLSPDEKTLYVANSHEPPPDHHGLRREADRSVANERIFFNGAELKKSSRT
jgi:gluconolactonase